MRITRSAGVGFAGTLGVALFATVWFTIPGNTAAQTPAAPRPAQAAPAPQVNDTRTTPEEFRKWMTTLNNWGRWGANDELGAINLITPAKRKQAAEQVKSGIVVSLAHNWLTEKAIDAGNPYKLLPRITRQALYAFDKEEIDFHGFTFSHFDSLCHVGYEGKLYNGYSFDETVSDAKGCKKLGVHNVKDKLITRGFLIDIPRLKGLPYLEPGTHVYREDIEAWEKKAGAKIQPGDAIFLRTGRWARRAAIGPFMNIAGFDASVIPLLKERDIAMIGHDAAQDVGTLPGIALPIHKFALAGLGANLMDNLDLEAVAETAAKLNRWTFFLAVAPNAVPQGTGSPINPLALF